MNYFNAIKRVCLFLIIFSFILIPNYLLAEQGVCPKYGRDNSMYRCWFGTEKNDRLFVFKDSIYLNGKIISSNKNNYDSKIVNIFWLLGGDDFIVAGYGVNEIHLGKGNDVAFLQPGSSYAINRVYGEDGNDTIYGSNSFVDILKGGDGDDFIWGFDGDDLLMGGKGRDTLHGQSGDDILVYDIDDLELDGGFGEDEFAKDSSNLHL